MIDREDADLDNLRRIVSDADAVPDDVFAAARAAVATRDLDAKLAALVADSAAVEAELLFEPVRRAQTEAADTRLLSFAGGGIHAELEVSRQADGLAVAGQLTGASPRGCRLQLGDGRLVDVDLDSLGRFLISGVVRGPTRLRCESASGDHVSTPWVWL